MQRKNARVSRTRPVNALLRQRELTVLHQSAGNADKRRLIDGYRACAGSIKRSLHPTYN